MMTLFREGGWPMYFVVAFGLATLAVAARFAMRPVRAQLGTIVGLGAAVLFTVLMATCADLGAVGHHMNERWAEYVDYPPARAVLQGFAESMSPGVMGFSFLALAGFLVAVGWPRLAPAEKT